jgi:signal transduction histidine kinase
VSAQYAAVGVPDDDGSGFAQFIHAGMSDELVEQIGPLPRTHGLLGSLLADPKPFRTDDVSADPRFRWWPHAHPRMRSFLGVPIVFKGDVVGAFYLADKEGAPAFGEDDEAVIGVLAAHAAVAIENARLYEHSRELSIVEERTRVARELHDALAQTLFSLGLTAGAAAALVRTDPDRAEAELATVQDLARAAASEVRSLVFELRPTGLDDDGLAPALAKHLELVGRAHGLDVSMTVPGRAVDRLPPGTEAQLFRIAQEALTNVVRHASARSATVSLVAGDGSVTLTVSDDGDGFDPAARSVRSRRLGLTSMRERAAALGGRLTIESAPGEGTTVTAVIPA